MRTLVLYLIRPTLTLNELQRMHFRTLREHKAKLSWELRAQLKRTELGQPPMARARLSIWRYSAGIPDRDNLIGGCKPLIDVLLVPRTHTTKGGLVRSLHPYGLSLVADDAPDVLELSVEGMLAPRAGGSTAIRLEELPPARGPPGPPCHQ